MIKFILIRHGQTEWNKSDRFRGRVDIPLNGTGEEQARKVAAFLKNEKIDAIYSSPLQRAVHTAQPLADEHHLQVQINPDLNDVDVGALEGMTVDEARQAFPDVVEKWLNAPGHLKFPKGESIKALKGRLDTLLAEMATHHDGQTVALVSHRVVCLALLCLVLGLDMDSLWRLRQDNACIDLFEMHGDSYTVTLMNETSHL